MEEVKVYCKNPTHVKRPQDVIDPADVCQVKSSFPNLNIRREQKLLDELDAAVNYWNGSLERVSMILSPICLPIQELSLAVSVCDFIFNFLQGLCVEDCMYSSIVAASGYNLLQVGFLYSLWGHNSAAAKAFQVCSTFARKMSLDDLLLQGIISFTMVLDYIM